MKKRHFFVLFLSLALMLMAKAWLVKVVKTNVLSQPDFLSDKLSILKKGDRVTVMEEKGDWCLVQSTSGVKGYVHQSALIESKSSLTGIIPGQKGVSDDEVALAAKGFNEENEKKIKGNREFNFADLEWVMSRTFSPADLKKFVHEGKLK
jgi:uncharacterized protein YgiM (DUF1202 family)